MCYYIYDPWLVDGTTDTEGGRRDQSTCGSWGLWGSWNPAPCRYWEVTGPEQCDGSHSQTSPAMRAFPVYSGLPRGLTLSPSRLFFFLKENGYVCVCVHIYIYTHTYNTHTHRLYINIDTYAGCTYICFPGGSAVKGSTCQCRRYGFDPWLGKIPWRRKWQPRQYSCLENPINRGGWQGRGSQQIWTRLSD